jgi:hypothetical protein
MNIVSSQSRGFLAKFGCMIENPHKREEIFDLLEKNK